MHAPQQTVDIISPYCPKLNHLQEILPVYDGALSSHKVGDLVHSECWEAGTESESALLIYIYQQQLLVLVSEEIVDLSRMAVSPHARGNAIQDHTVLDKMALCRKKQRPKTHQQEGRGDRRGMGGGRGNKHATYVMSHMKEYYSESKHYKGFKTYRAAARDVTSC